MPVKVLAKLVNGLGGNSRIKQKVSGLACSPDTFLLATIVDKLNILIWQQTKDGSHGRNVPESISEKFMIKDKNKKTIKGYETVDDYERARKQFIRR